MTQPPPLFIVGAPRSGNTLVRRVLLASGQIYIPPETYVLGDMIKAWPRWFALPWREKVWLFCAYFDRHPHRAELDIVTLSPFADQAADWPPADRRLDALLQGFYRFCAIEQGFTDARWGDKTPWNTIHLKRIARFFPRAQYLQLVRDGRDSVASQLKADMRGTTEAAHRWVQANEICERVLPRYDHLRMRYEDIVSDPAASFARIFAWAGLTFDERHLTDMPARMGDVTMRDHHAAVLAPITPQSIGNWRSSMTQADLDALSPRFSKMLAGYGYT